MPHNHMDSAPAPQLSDRQRQVLIWMARGWSYQEIADGMFISRRTVERDAADAARALGAKGLVSVGAHAFARGILTQEDLTDQAGGLVRVVSESRQLLS